MTKDKIGLKLANGEFYPVLEDGSAARKRLVVTTVQDGQRSVQIDLYRGSGRTIIDAAYIGSLVIENIPLAPHGEPDIRLDLGLSADGTLEAFAENVASGERQSLTVSLESLAEEEKYEIPDFRFEEEATDQLPEEAPEPLEEEPAWSAPRREAEGEGLLARASGIGAEEERRGPRDRKPLYIALVVLAAILVALGLAYIVYSLGMSRNGGAAMTEEPSAQAAPAAVIPVEPAAPAAAAPPPAPVPAAPTPAAAPVPAAPAAAAPAKPEAAARQPGVYYTIRWGDTLWDLAFAYYRNPWLYPKIAKANGIKNPDYIISGRKIYIPPR